MINATRPYGGDIMLTCAEGEWEEEDDGGMHLTLPGNLVCASQLSVARVTA